MLLIIWFLLSNNGSISKKILPVPQEVFIAFKNLLLSGDIFLHVGISFKRALIGFLIGGGLGILLGVIKGLFPIADRFLDTTIQMFRNIPHLALLPLVVILDVTYYQLIDNSLDDFLDNFYDENYPGISELEQIAFTDWFSQCWKKSGGDILNLPSFFVFHDDTKSYELKNNQWIDDEEKWS
ncbi:MAG: hypothetical protein ACQEXK_18870 [Bacillota bacterium]